ncbi:MAG: hypothetical protein DRP78_01990 [Candidatus Omnitrophota bacterium]|nr:MAG: hypothetical protein DRP78_01990 [Candidatus Omnitrophota bacterium]
MKLKDKISIGCSIVKAKLLKESIPLFVAWSLTNRCNLSCKYCNRQDINSTELETAEIFLIIEQLKNSGTKIISFTGGEPLLRADIGEIINYTCKCGIYVNINTNGTLFSQKINALNNITSVKFSLDGPKKVNDYIRGKDSFQKVVEAIKIAKRRRIAVSIVTVLSKYNLDSVDYLINLAENLGIGILFQPPTLTLLGTDVVNPHIPDVSGYRDVVDKLIVYRKRSETVLNSIKGLTYLRGWPDGRDIFCYNKNISCRIETDGYLYHCGRMQDKTAALNCLRVGPSKAFDALKDVSCNNCWCALRLENNFIASLDLRVIFSILKNSKWRDRI